MSTTPDLSLAQWRKSSFSGNGGANCVEVADGFPGVVPVRDSKVPEGASLTVPASAWRAFVGGLVDGELSA